LNESTTLTLLDGPVGTELIARGVPAPGDQWSAWANLHRPAAVQQLHREYAAAGATVHTANTFRTKRRSLGPEWEQAARAAVRLARGAVPDHHRIAGSIAPLEDCYRPDLSPANSGPEHRELADVLAEEGVDLLLCETFPNPREALVAVEQAVATGLETWVALTAGPQADLLSPDQLSRAAEDCVAAGASACLVNCVAADQSLRYLEQLVELPVCCGVYANAGAPTDRVGWGEDESGPTKYLGYARQWIAAGAGIVGGCCGTDPQHISALAELFGGRG